MKIRVYEKEQLNFFPLFLDTTDINFLQPKIVRPNGYECNQIFYVDSGNAILKIDGNTYHLSGNDMFYISANIPHEYYGTDSDFTTSYLSFFGDGFDNICKFYKLDDYAVYKNKSRGVFKSSIETLFNSMDTTHEVSALCAQTFLTVITYFDEACKKECSPIENVYNYIESNYSRMITLDDILTVYPYSKTKLCHDFKEKYNVTIFEMITNIRLRHARHFINTNPDIKLKNIAESCGFNDISYFCKMYKKFYNHSPKNIFK